MKPWLLLAGASLALALFRFGVGQTPAPPANAPLPAATAAFRITFGELQEQETDYSGTLSLAEGQVRELIPWRFFGNDQLEGANSWSLRTARANMENQPDQPRPISTPGPGQNIVPKGISAIVDAPATANATVQTRHGTYAFRLSDLAAGRVVRFEDGDVTVQAEPAPLHVSPVAQQGMAAEHDYPSLSVSSDGSAWAIWQVYEGGGDRVLGSHFTASGWSAPESLTPAGQDVFRSAAAQDARGRTWAVWSQREGENWNLAGRNNDGRGWSAVQTLTKGSGPNFFH